MLIDALLAVPGAVLVFSMRGFAQALTADRLGDPTPRNMGRLTLNPIRHLDIIGFIFICLFGFGWTKPVQVNTRNFKNIKRDNAIFLLSGPVSCILLGFVLSFFTALIGHFFAESIMDYGVWYYIYLIFYTGTSLAVTLAAFYLLPLPGLDGYNLIANFLPYNAYRKLYYVEKYSMFIFMGFILLMRFTALGSIIFWPANQLINLFFRLWGLFL